MQSESKDMRGESNDDTDLRKPTPQKPRLAVMLFTQDWFICLIQDAGLSRGNTLCSEIVFKGHMLLSSCESLLSHYGMQTDD